METFLHEQRQPDTPTTTLGTYNWKQTDENSSFCFVRIGVKASTGSPTKKTRSSLPRNDCDLSERDILGWNDQRTQQNAFEFRQFHSGI